MNSLTTGTPDVATWHGLPASEVLARTASSADGLTTEEAARRLGQYGPNALADAEPIRPLAILAAQFTSFVVWLLIGAGIVSGLVGEWIDAAAILAIVALNAAIGFYQEYNAERALAALKQITSPKAKVYRDGRVVTVLASEVVPGDVVTLESGDLVPADARLLRASSLRTVEAALTGESEPGRLPRLNFILVGVGDAVNEEQMEDICHEEYPAVGHLWCHRIAEEITQVAELVAVLVDETMTVAAGGTITDDRGTVLKIYEARLPAVLEFDVPEGAESFTLEVAGQRFTQPLPEEDHHDEDEEDH